MGMWDYDPSKPVSYYQREVDSLRKTSQRPRGWWIGMLVVGLVGVGVAAWQSSMPWVILAVVSTFLIVSGLRFLNLGGVGGVSPQLAIAESNLARRLAEDDQRQPEPPSGPAPI